jgi:hypothetical protein
MPIFALSDTVKPRTMIVPELAVMRTDKGQFVLLFLVAVADFRNHFFQPRLSQNLIHLFLVHCHRVALMVMPAESCVLCVKCYYSFHNMDFYG